MARIRSTHPGAPRDEDVATLSIYARYLWAYMPCHADREGRLKDSAFNLKLEVFPGEDEVDVEAMLAELASKKLIIRYEVGAKRYIQIRNFLRWQNPHKREPESAIPAQVTVSIEAQASPGRTGPGPGATGTGPAVRSDQIQSGTVAPAWPGSIPDPDPAEAAGLIALVKAAVEKAHPELGLYQPGHWAFRSASAFVEQIPPEARTDILRAEVRRRIAAFAACSDARITKGSWSVEAFCEAYNRLGQVAVVASGIASLEAGGKRLAAKISERYR
jgi:hypothetical protein